MLKTDRTAYIFLKSRGFKLLEEDESSFFGDYCYTFINEDVEIRIGSSKSQEFVDVCNAQVGEDWYDLPLVLCFLRKEYDLKSHIPPEQQYNFLEEDLDKIRENFKSENYQDTKKILNSFRDQRMKQIFPDL